MHKNALFLLKNCKNLPAAFLPPGSGDWELCSKLPSSGGLVSPSDPPMASGGWELRPQTPAKTSDPDVSVVATF